MSALTSEIALRDLYTLYTEGRMNYAQYCFLHARQRCDTRGMSWERFRLEGGTREQYDAIERGFII